MALLETCTFVDERSGPTLGAYHDSVSIFYFFARKWKVREIPLTFALVDKSNGMLRRFYGTVSIEKNSQLMHGLHFGVIDACSIAVDGGASITSSIKVDRKGVGDEISVIVISLKNSNFIGCE